MPAHRMIMRMNMRMIKDVLRLKTLVTSQIPVENWHAALGDPMLADAILDRLVHNTYRINLSGESMRKRKKSLTTHLLSE